MLNISLIDINRKAPYKVKLTTEDTYTFTTDYGTIYEIGFIEDQMLGIENVYQFFIAPKNNISQPKDRKIQSTITAIIEAFFKNHEVLLDYICDTNDGKQAIRNRLFNHWFSAYPNKRNFTLRTITVFFEEISFYAAVIFRNDNPNYEECLLAVDKFENEIRDKLK